MTVTLLLIIGLWNQVSDFKTAYLQALLFLQVMNWYDGIIIDKVWVGYSKFWIIKGTESIPYVQTWKEVLKKRIFLSLIWIVGAAIVAGIQIEFIDIGRYRTVEIAVYDYRSIVYCAGNCIVDYCSGGTEGSKGY